MIYQLLPFIGYRGFVIIGFLPLLYLTGTSLWNAVAQSGQSEVAAAEDWVVEAKAKADELATKANGDHPPVVWLERRLPAPFRDDSLTDPPNQTAATPECQTLLAKWDSFVHLRGLATDFTNTVEKLVDPSGLPTEFEDEWCKRSQDKAAELEGILKEIQQSLTSLKELKQKLDPGGDVADEPTRNILRIIDSLATVQEVAKTRLERMNANLTTLVSAEKSFQVNDYAKCLKELESWQGSLPPVVEELRRSVDFQKRGTEWSAAAAIAKSGGPNKETWQPLIDDARQLVQIDYSSAPSRANAALHEHVRQSSVCLQAGLAIEELGEPKSLEAWLREAKTIDVEFRCQDNKRQLGKSLKKWMEDSLPAKKVPKSEFEYAEMDDGSIKVGVFEPNGINAYKFWTPDKHKKRMPYDTIPKVRFVKFPGPLPTSVAIDSYNNERAKLQRMIRTKEAWETFADACERIQGGLIAFREKGGTVDISLEGEILFAGAILKHWSELEPYLE